MRIFILIITLLFTGCLIPQKMINPVKGANNSSWNHETFWHYPWGNNRVHKGIDIFAKKGTPILAPQSGFYVYSGETEVAGNYVLMVGPLFRFHYFAHLDSVYDGIDFYISKNDTIGFVGNTGNAINTPYHLHYAIFTPIPYPWRWSSEVKGWQKMFYLDPGEKIMYQKAF